MSLSDLFGDLEDDEEDYRPDNTNISDIESVEEMEVSSSTVLHQDKSPENEPGPFNLEEEVLKPMKPPEFDSDEDDTTDRPEQPNTAQSRAPVISSDESADDTADLTQLNKNLFGSDHEVDEDKETNDNIQNPNDFFKDSDDEDVMVHKSQKTTAADLFGSDVDDDSDGEKAGTADQTTTQQDIFGSDVSVSDDDTAAKPVEKKASDDEDLHALHRVQRSDGESDEEKDEESELPVEMPLVDINLGENLNLIKLPNFISIDTRPFDAETYEDEIEDDNEVTDEEGRSRLKLKVENTIRWRHSLDERGNLIKQSNSRIVKWSDGSMSLFVGSEEFDIMNAPLTGSHSHLYVKHGAGIQGQAQFKNKMMFKIHSTDSYTHRKMTMRISDRVSKASKVKTLPSVGKNPEAKREEICKKEEERLQAQRRRENMQKKIREKNMNKQISTRYLEPDNNDYDDEGESISAIKNSYKSGGGGKQKKKPVQKKVSDVYSSDEEEEEALLEEEEEEEAVATDESDSDDNRKKQKKKPTVIESDEDDSD